MSPRNESQGLPATVLLLVQRQAAKNEEQYSENWVTQGNNNRSVSSVISFDLFQLSNELLTSDDFSVLHVKLLDWFIHFSTGDYQPEPQNEIESPTWFDKKQKPQGRTL